MKKKGIKVIEGTSYKNTIESIRKRVNEAQYRSFQKVNIELIKMYWDIGKVIYERQKEEGWGNSVVKTMSKDLQQEFKGVSGFSKDNLFRMKSFYSEYRDNIKVAPLVPLLGWSHNIIIMQKCKNDLQREYYIRMAIQQSWPKRLLEKKIINQEYERWAINQSNFETILPVDLAKKGEVMLKDEYNLEFLEIAENSKEREIEDSIMQHITKFLHELGGDMMFVGRQFRIDFEDKEYFIDLLFYHKKLRSYVIIELKAGEFKPEYTGKMITYLALVEGKLRDKAHDNPTIGIILCESKNRTLVDMSLKYITRPVGVATYKIADSRNELPRNLQEYLPTKEQIARKLINIIH